MDSRTETYDELAAVSRLVALEQKVERIDRQLAAVDEALTELLRTLSKPR